MHHADLHRWQHAHSFDTDGVSSGERRTHWVLGLTVLMMVVELYAGAVYHSMALLADGWHMASHAAALAVAAFAYAFTRRHAQDAQFTFGTGKVGALGGFGSAVGLALIAALVFVESIGRLVSPLAISFDEAVGVAGLGLVVNVVSALLLHDSEHHAHADHDNNHHDHNLRGAYLHVLADALTSVFAIAALLAGKLLGWAWMDAVTGMLGAVVIAHWSLGLLRDTSAVLLDSEVSHERRARIVETVEADADNRVCDLHLWRVGPRHLGAIVSVVTHAPREPEHYKRLLADFHDLAHVTVEVHPCRESPVSHGSSSR